MEWLGQLALSVATAAAASWVAVQLALRRFYHEKWWEQRFGAYTAVIDALHRFNRIVRKELSNRNRNANSRQAAENISEPIDAIWRAIDMGELFLSPEMLVLLRATIRNVRTATRNDADEDAIPAIARILERAIPQAVDIARCDLQLSGSQLPWKKRSIAPSSDKDTPAPR